MRIGIEINGVLRDTIGKFTQLYEKHLIDEIESNNPTYLMDLSGNTEVTLLDDPFKYEKLSDVTCSNVDLLISANVSGDCAETSVTIKPKQWQ